MTRRLVGPLAAAALLAFAGVAVAAPSARAQSSGTGDDRVLVFLVPSVSFEDLLSVREVEALSRAGGVGLMTVAGELPTSDGEDLGLGEGVSVRWLDPRSSGGLEGVGREIDGAVRSSSSDRVLVFVGSTTSSPEMVSAKDDLHPLVMAEGAPAELFPVSGHAGSLTSDSTRRDGVVTDADVVTTIADRLGEPAPAGSTGSVIRVISVSPPFELHERYLAQRRMVVPIGVAAGLYVTFIGLAGIALLALRRRVPPWLLGLDSWLVLSVPGLATALLLAGHLPSLSYATVVPVVVLATAAATLAVIPLARRSVLAPANATGAWILMAFAVEAALGWSALLTPFLGGGQLEGGRFYGLPNVAIGLLAGAALYVAHRLRTGTGFVLVVATALFAGLPQLGANLGAAVTVFAAAGIWLALRERDRLGALRGTAIALGVVALGVAAVLLAHRLSPIETHVTRFEEASGGLVGAWSTFVDRLGVGVDLIRRNPFALVPVVGVLVALAVALRPPASVRTAFERHPVWRDVVVAILASGVVAYVANDSGPAATGFAFGCGVAAMLFVSLRVALGSRTGKMEGR